MKQFPVGHCSCAIACAQPAETVRLRGTIEKADGNALALKSADGAGIMLTLTNDARVIVVVKASMADIKENTFLGSAAMPQPDGTQKALEVHIFPEQMRGTGRPYPCDVIMALSMDRFDPSPWTRPCFEDGAEALRRPVTDINFGKSFYI